MILQAIFLLLKVLVSFIAVILFYITWKHFKAMKRLDFYKAQGVSISPGSRKFFFGSMSDLMNKSKHQKDLPLKVGNLWILEQDAKLNGDEDFEAHRNPIVFLNMLG